MSWAETKERAELVRRVGVLQFLATYHRLKERRGDELKWGDEVGLLLRRERVQPRDKYRDGIVTQRRGRFLRARRPPSVSPSLLPFLLFLQIEYTLIAMDEEGKRARLSLVGPQILTGLQQPEENDPNHLTKWRPEYASYMIEGEGEREREERREGGRGRENKIIVINCIHNVIS